MLDGKCAISVPFTFKRMSIPEVILVEAKAFNDERGYFAEIYNESNFIEWELTHRLCRTTSRDQPKGPCADYTIQLNPEAQAKLVFAIRGTIFDVAVDVRHNSATYGQWVGEVISDGNHRGLFVPEGFAHGFCVMSDAADVFYKVTKEYSSLARTRNNLERYLDYDQMADRKPYAFCEGRHPSHA